MNLQDLNEWLGRIMSTLPHGNPAESMELEHEIESTSGGSLVRVVIGTQGGITKINIDPLLLDKENVGHLEQLIIAAVNDGHGKYQDAVKKRMLASFMKNMPKDLDLGRMMSEAFNKRDR